MNSLNTLFCTHYLFHITLKVSWGNCRSLWSYISCITSLWRNTLEDGWKLPFNSETVILVFTPIFSWEVYPTEPFPDNGSWFITYNKASEIICLLLFLQWISGKPPVNCRGTVQILPFDVLNGLQIYSACYWCFKHGCFMGSVLEPKPNILHLPAADKNVI